VRTLGPKWDKTRWDAAIMGREKHFVKSIRTVLAIIKRKGKKELSKRKRPRRTVYRATQERPFGVITTLGEVKGSKLPAGTVTEKG